MKHQRLVIAVAVGLLAFAAQAQTAQIVQQGNGDLATIEQVTPFGSTSSATISQQGGSSNVVTVLQVVAAPGSTTANITQSGTIANSAHIYQSGTSNGTRLDLFQAGGTDSSAQLIQFTANNARINAYQNATGSHMYIQQMEASAGAYAAGEQVGNGLSQETLQGQPGAGVSNSSSRIFQYGQNSTGATRQWNLSNSVSYISQGSPQEPGKYWAGTARGWVEVEPGIVASNATDSDATVWQTDAFAVRAYILQYGSNQSAYVSQSGSNNLGGILQTGPKNTALVFQTGFGGTATVSQHGTGANAVISQGGTGNTAAIRQR